MDCPHWRSRNGGVATMAMLQRDNTIEAIERLDASLLSMPSCMVTRKRPSASAKSCAG
jgi:hypothetical protein